MSSKPEPSPWSSDAPVGAFGIGAGIIFASMSVAALHVSGWLAVLFGMVFGLLAQVALTNLLLMLIDRLRQKQQKQLPTVAVEVRDSVIVIRVSYARDDYCEAEMSPDGAMELARSLVGASLELDKDSEHRVGLQ